MEFIEIGEGKLKLTLTREDMTYYQLSEENMEYGNRETRNAVYRIMDEVKAKIGFDITGERVLIQVYESKEGGCEMFVSKLGGRASGGECGGCRLEREKNECIYEFSDIETLLSMCRTLKSLGYQEASYAYAAETAPLYYLVIRARQSASAVRKNTVEEYAFLSEFGKRKDGSYAKAYIEEHCRLIGNGDAVTRLSRV